ncbi:MAG TPA: hypothetical protein VFT87_00285 [Candidatus Saccharimonadales bacterium]|nr:hypothetical protein [Candidatus Saccharimonadales bacterium]
MHKSVLPGQVSVGVWLRAPGIDTVGTVLLSSNQQWQDSVTEWAAHKCGTTKDQLEIEFRLSAV